MKIAYSLKRDAVIVLIIASRGKTQEKLANGYVARHLVDKGLLVRLPGRNTSYRLTLRGEAVIEHLQQREAFKNLFKE